MNFFSLHPSARFLLPMMLGIVAGNYFFDKNWASFGLPVFIGIWLLMLVAYRRYWFIFLGVLALAFFSGVGYVRTCQQISSVQIDLPDSTALYQVLLTEVPKEKAKSMQCRVLVEAVYGNDRVWTAFSEENHFLFYMAKDSLSKQLVSGDRLWTYTFLKRPVENLLPYGFDYAGYLYRKGISGTAYVSSGQWKFWMHSDEVSLVQLAQEARECVMSLYRKLGFQGDELAVLSALTIGEKEELGEDIKETYSISGASHVLALSGLHVGLIYGLLWFLFVPLWKRKKCLKIPLVGLILLSLWCFAFFTGFSTSVVRAVLMCSLFLLFSFRVEPVLSIDTLLATAFCMLLYKPLWLFDVGFQLSFAAVFAILTIQPQLYHLIQVRRLFLQKIWGLLTVSIAAQLGTAPLVLFYFMRFSPHFLLTNLWVIPLVTLVMYAAVVMLLMTPFPGLQIAFSSVVNGLLQVQHEGLRWIEQLPCASLDGITLDVWEVLFFYLLVVSAWKLFHHGIAENIFRFLAISLLWAASHAITVWHHAPHAGVAFYSVNGCTALHCMSSTSRSWLVCPDSLSGISSLKHSLLPYWNRMGLKNPVCVTGDYTDDACWVRQQIVCYGGKCIVMLTDQRWRASTSSHPLHVDYLLVANGYRGGIAELQPLFAIDKVILDAALPDYRQKNIQLECDTLGLCCSLLKEQGMLKYEW